MNINLHIFDGYTAKEVNFIAFDSGKCKATFSVAVKPPYPTPENTPPLWFECEAWNKIALSCQRYLRKGKQVLIKSHYKQERWQDKETGNLRCKPVYVVDELVFVGKRETDADADNY